MDIKKADEIEFLNKLPKMKCPIGYMKGNKSDEEYIKERLEHMEYVAKIKRPKHGY